MPSPAALEAYMDENQERYFAMFSDEKCGARGNWADHRAYISQVKNGLVSATTMETETPRASEYLIGLRRVFGEELHPRTAIRIRQLMALANAGFDCTHLQRQHQEMQAAKAAARARKKKPSGDAVAEARSESA